MKFFKKQRTVTLTIRAKINGKWTRTRAVYGKSGRVVPGLVVLGDRELRLDSVAYELRSYKKGKPTYHPAGSNASDAEEQRKSLASRLTAEAVAAAAGLEVVSDPERKTLKDWAREYEAIRSVSLGRDQTRRIGYVQALFFESCDKTYVDEVGESDMLSFLTHLINLPLLRNPRAKQSNRRNAMQRRQRNPVTHGKVSKRTAFNYYTVACKWLATGGVNKAKFPPAPKFEEPIVTVYSAEELKAFLAVVDGSLRIATSLMLKCGMRRREVSHAYFTDIDFEQKTIRIEGKPEWNFVVKNYVPRRVPVPDDLLEELRQWATQHPGQLFIVPNSAGKPEMALIKSLKRFVYLHGLRCGRCNHCRMGNPNCEEWELHKFRRTYATGLVRHVDLRTAQQYLGHKRITSTERYLRAASASDGQKRVSAIDWTKSFYE